MKLLLFITFTVIGLSTAAQLSNTYLPPSSASTAGGHGGFLQGPSHGGSGSPSNQYVPPKTTFNQQGQPVQWSHGGWSAGGAGGQQSSWQGGAGGGAGGGSGSYGGSSSGGHRYSGSAQSSVNGYSHGSGGGGIPSYRPQKPQVPILKLENENDGLGNYHFDYQTGDGTSHQQQGHVNNPNTDWAENVVQGQYSYTGDDGKQYTVSYKADGNGFQAVGDHLPTPPPQPREIQEVWNRVLSQQAAAGGADWSQGGGAGSGSGSYHGGASGGRPSYQGAGGSAGHHGGAGAGAGSWQGAGSGTSWQQQQSYGSGGAGRPHGGFSGGSGGGSGAGFGGAGSHHGGVGGGAFSGAFSGAGAGAGAGGRPQKPQNQYLPPHGSGSAGADGYHY